MTMKPIEPGHAGRVTMPNLQNKANVAHNGRGERPARPQLKGLLATGSICFRAVPVLAGLAAALAQAQPVIDDSPTRVQTTLKVDLRPVGTLRPKAVGEVSATRWTLDCGGMDREHADWRAVREYVAPLGIARIRQQGGWARTEKDPGKYDFSWLDQVVFDAKKRGISVWMELSYGNPMYPGGGGRQLAAGIPRSEEGLAAWDRWVEAMARRYKGTVTDWCVWNEPDIVHAKNSPEEAATFAIRTAGPSVTCVPPGPLKRLGPTPPRR